MTKNSTLHEACASSRNEMQSCNLLRTQSIVVRVSETLSLLDSTVSFYGVFRESEVSRNHHRIYTEESRRLHELRQHKYKKPDNLEIPKTIEIVTITLCPECAIAIMNTAENRPLRVIRPMTYETRV